MEHWLDDVARTVASGVTRRQALRRIGGGLAAAIVASFGLPSQKAEAKLRCEHFPDTPNRCPARGSKAICTNLKTDANNCGSCGARCSSLNICVDGKCVAGPAGCAVGQTPCNGVCRDLNSDNANCGACGRVCNAPTSSCRAG